MTSLAISELDAADFEADSDVSAPSGSPRSLAELSESAERVQDYAGRSKSAATIKAYASGWRDFLAFCSARGLPPLPATDETVAAYLVDLADRGAKAATIARRLVVISQAHRAADLASLTSSSLVGRVHAGIRRTIGTAQTGKAPALVADLKLMLEKLPGARVGLRDRAVLLLGFAGAFRRAELVSLDVNDLEFSRAGLIVTLRKSKTDQEEKVGGWAFRSAFQKARARCGPCRPGSSPPALWTGPCSGRWIALSACSRVGFRPSAWL